MTGSEKAKTINVPAAIIDDTKDYSRCASQS